MAVMRTNFIWDFCLLTRIMWFKLPSSGTRVSPISLVKKDFRQHYSSYPFSIPARSLLDWSWSVTKSDTKQKAFPPLPLKSVKGDEPIRWRHSQLFSHRKMSVFYNCWDSAGSARGRSFKTLCCKMLKKTLACVTGGFVCWARKWVAKKLLVERSRDRDNVLCAKCYLGGTPLYKSDRYVPPQRVWFLRRFGLKTGLDVSHVGLESGMVFHREPRECMNVSCHFNSKWI